MHKLTIIIKQLFVTSRIITFCSMFLLTSFYSSAYTQIEENPQQTHKSQKNKDDNKEKGIFTKTKAIIGTVAVGGATAALTMANRWLHKPKPHNPHVSINKFKANLAKLGNPEHATSSLLASIGSGSTELAAITPSHQPSIQIPHEAESQSCKIKTTNPQIMQILSQLERMDSIILRIMVDGNEVEDAPRMEVENRVHAVLRYDMQRLFLLVELIDTINLNNLLDDEGLLHYVCALARDLEDIFAHHLLHCGSELIIKNFIDLSVIRLNDHPEREEDLIILSEVVGFLTGLDLSAVPSTSAASASTSSSDDNGFTRAVEETLNEAPDKYRGVLSSLLLKLKTLHNMRPTYIPSHEILARRKQILELFNLKLLMNPNEVAAKRDLLRRYYYDRTTTPESDFVALRGQSIWSAVTTITYTAESKAKKDKQVVMIKRTKLNGLPFTRSECPDSKKEDELLYGPTTFVNEYITAPLYRLALYDRAPMIELVSCPRHKNVLALRSKFLLNFRTLLSNNLIDYNQYEKFIHCGDTSHTFEGMEKVFAAMILFSEGDIHEHNLGYISLDANRSIIAKIDHGRSTFDLCTDLESFLNGFLLFNGSKGGLLLNYPHNIYKFIEALEQVLSIPEDAIKEIINRRIMELDQAGLKLTEIEYHWWSDGREQKGKFEKLEDVKKHYIAIILKQRQITIELLGLLKTLIEQHKQHASDTQQVNEHLWETKMWRYEVLALHLQLMSSQKT